MNGRIRVVVLCQTVVFALVACVGPPGANGAAGAPGANGANGSDGSSGANGLDGIDGADGQSSTATASWVPARLADIEGKAEDAYDTALAADYDAVINDAGDMTAGWRYFRDFVRADGASADQIASLDVAIAGLNAAVADRANLTDFELARAANAISEPMDELFSVYQDPVPAIVLALDYGGREVQLDGYQGAFEAALVHIGNCQRQYNSVKPQVLAVNGADTASAYEASLAAQIALAEAGDGAGLVLEAETGLDLVDLLEDLFWQ